jgi:glycosyltransferase involved in cell wall biosynthesis
VRICMITSVPVPPTEGVGYYIWNLADFLRESGHRVQIVTRGQRGKPFYEVLEEIPVWRPRFYSTYPLHVHLHGLFVQRLVQRLEAEVDLFHLHTPLPPPIRTGRPVLLTVHSMVHVDVRSQEINSVFELLTKLMSPVGCLIEKRLLHTSQTITAVSKVAARDAQRCLSRDERIEITWNGVDPHLFCLDTHNSADPNRLLYVGRLAPGKGLRDLVQALELVILQYPEVRISLAGDGPLRGEITSLIKRSGLEENMKLLGHVDSRERLCALYQRAWGLILSSRHESLPTVILEAMACGTPVIATRVGSVMDVISDGVSGILVPPRAPEQMAEAICRLLGDAALRARLGATARHTVEERFSWQAVGSNYLRCYQTLLNEAGR